MLDLGVTCWKNRMLTTRPTQYYPAHETRGTSMQIYIKDEQVISLLDLGHFASSTSQEPRKFGWRTTQGMLKGRGVQPETLTVNEGNLPGLCNSVQR